MNYIAVEPDYATQAACHTGDHGGEKGHCPDCGHVNYRLLGWFGARARWAKAWGVTEQEAEDRMARTDIEKRLKSGELEGVVEDYL